MTATVTMTAPLIGIFRVGTADALPIYTSLSAAVADINLNSVGGILHFYFFTR